MKNKIQNEIEIETTNLNRILGDCQCDIVIVGIRLKNSLSILLIIKLFDYKKKLFAYKKSLFLFFMLTKL